MLDYICSLEMFGFYQADENVDKARLEINIFVC